MTAQVRPAPGPAPRAGAFAAAGPRLAALLLGAAAVAWTATPWLEVQHQVRPWHTAALGAVLAAYLLVTHIAESGADTGLLLRGHARLLAAGACLLALGAGFAMIPAGTPGAGSAILRVLAAAAVIAATALVVPGRDDPGPDVPGRDDRGWHDPR